MRRTFGGALLCALASACTVSVPASPDTRQKLPACDAGSLPASDGTSYGCKGTDEFALDVSNAQTADYARTADHALTAGTTGHAAYARAMAPSGHLVLGDAPNAGGKAESGLEVYGTVFGAVGAGAPFQIGSFDSDPGSVISTGAQAAIPFLGGQSELTLSVPPRPGSVFGVDAYLVVIRASGAVRTDGYSNAPNTCTISVAVDPDGVGPALPSRVLSTIWGYGRPVNPSPEYPWVSLTQALVKAGTFSISVELKSESSQTCETGVDLGELTHLEVIGY